MPTIMELLSGVLNPNPGAGGLLSQAGYLQSTGLGPEQLARYHQQSGVGGSAPQGAPPEAIAPQQAPIPGQAPQAPAAPSGGGIGGLLSGLFGGGESARKNETISWLQQQGMDPGTATLMAGNKQALQQYLLQRSQGGGGSEFDQRAQAAQRYGLEGEAAQQFILTGKTPEPPNMREDFGLNPIYGKDKDGNIVVMQPRKQGGLQMAEIPEGVTLQPGVDKIDLGTAWGITDRSGQVVSTIPKDLAGAEAQKAGGKARGEAAFDIPRIEQNASQTLAVIEQLKAHPGRAGSTGFVQGRLPAYSGDTQDFQVLLAQAKGKTFLEAYQTLKGGGQITEVEGKKAEEAIVRLNRAQSDDTFMAALTDFEDVIRKGLARARQQAGLPSEESFTPSQPDPARFADDPNTAKSGRVGRRLKFNPATGALE